MFKGFPKYFEFRLLAVLGSIALSIYLLQIAGSFISMFTDVFMILILSWLLAFVLDPLVKKLESKSFSRFQSASVVYAILVITSLSFVAYVIPVTITQLSALSATVPKLFVNAPIWASHVEGIITSALSNSVSYAQAIASFLATSLLILIISFYLILERSHIENWLIKLVPEKFKEDYAFLQNTLNTTFASFLRVQVLIGLIVGAVTFLVLAIFSIEYSLSAGILSAILAMIPVIGPIISIVPPALAVANLPIQTAIFTAVILFLIYQLIYNIISPKLVGSALKIHPIVVLLSFIIGYKLFGLWGAIFSVPIVVSAGIIIKELLRYWNIEED